MECVADRRDEVSTRMLPWMITQVDNLRSSFEKSCSSERQSFGVLPMTLTVP